VLVVRKAAKSLFLGYQPSHFIAEEVNRVVKESLPSKSDKPMYVWVHYLDVHAPLGLWGRVGRGLWNKIKFYWNEYAMFLFGDFPLVKYIPYFSAVSLYDDSIRYVDREAKKLVEYLESIGVIDEHSMIVINADHGEAFLDHGELMRTQKLYNENIHVPLLVLSPENRREVVTRPVSLVDVAPTILEFAGVAKPESYVGKNLFDTTSRPVVSQASDCAGDLSNPTYAGVALIAEDYKLIHTKEKSYLFASSDTKEMQNLYDTKPARLAELESKIKPYSTPSWKEA
jgi:arylsulfatase